MAQIAAVAVMAVGALYKGSIQKKLKDQEEIGYDQAANRRLAAASREVSEEERNKEFIESRALAVSAASGGGTGHGVTKILADLNAEGMYRMMSRLWVGQDEADGLRFRADQAAREGDAAVQGSYVNAVTSAVGTASSFGWFDPKVAPLTPPPPPPVPAPTTVAAVSGVTGGTYMVPPSMVAKWGSNIPISALNRAGIMPSY